MIYSYDVFDTVITRKTATPQGVFALMQERLHTELDYEDIPEDIRLNFFELRVAAERLARDYFCGGEKEEVTHREIYLAMNTTQELTNGMIDRLIELECTTELQNSMGVFRVVREIEDRVRNGERVVLISDMYLSKEILRKMLAQTSSLLAELPLYVSSEYGKTKATGNLFELVQKIEQVSYAQWHHTGDDEKADREMPQRLGITTHLITHGRLLAIEQGILKSEEDHAAIQLLLGVSKNARFLKGLNGAANIGASLGAILLVDYVRWIIGDAISRGIETLYFVARDGYVLKMIADILIENGSFSLKTKYIYGSRKAWRMPSHVIGDLDVMQLLFASTPEFITNLSQIADVFEISEEEVRGFLKLDDSDEIGKLSRLDVEAIFYMLSEKEEFCEFIKNRQKSTLWAVRGYLAQEIDIHDEEIAFVEVGGTGYTQKCVAKILRDMGAKSISTYYFNLYSVDPMEKEVFRNFMPDGLYMKDAIEPLCRALHGQTMGYVQRDGVYEPLLDHRESMEVFQKCGYEEYIKGIRAYLEELVSHYPEILKFPINRKVIRKCWNYYTHVSDRYILDFIGEIPFDVRGAKQGKYAPKLSEEDIRNIYGKQTDSSPTWFYNGASLNMSRLRMTANELELADKLKTETVKTGSHKKAVSKFVRIPDGKYPKGTAIALYGAGGLGKELRNQILGNADYKLAIWCDRNYKVMQREGLEVSDPSKLTEVCFDVLLIAIFKRSVAEMVKTELISKGVPSESVQWISPEDFLEGNRRVYDKRNRNSVQHRTICGTMFE